MQLLLKAIKKRMVVFHHVCIKMDRHVLVNRDSCSDAYDKTISKPSCIHRKNKQPLLHERTQQYLLY